MAYTNNDFAIVERPFSDVDSNTHCAQCDELLDGKQVVSVPNEYPDVTFCSLLCACKYSETHDPD